MCFVYINLLQIDHMMCNFDILIYPTISNDILTMLYSSTFKLALKLQIRK